MLRGAPECSMSSARKFALVKMAREAQKPLAKMEFFTSLWLVGYRLSRALPCSYYLSDSFRMTTKHLKHACVGNFTGTHVPGHMYVVTKSVSTGSLFSALNRLRKKPYSEVDGQRLL